MNDKKNSRAMVSLDLGASLPPPSFMGIKPARLSFEGDGLPRTNKVELEVGIAIDFLDSISKANELPISNIRTNNPSDPPDVLFELHEDTFGIELSELTPVNRLERDNVLRRLKESIISKMRLSSTTKDWVISISLDSVDARKINARGVDNQIVETLTRFFSSEDIKLDDYNLIKLPKNRGTIQLYKADLSSEPRIEGNQPLIVFSGHNTLIYPDYDVPEIVEKTLKEKFSISTSIRSWLLLWSEHISLASLDNEIIRAIDQYCLNHRHLYEKIVYRSLRNDKYAILTFK